MKLSLSSTLAILFVLLLVPSIWAQDSLNTQLAAKFPPASQITIETNWFPGSNISHSKSDMTMSVTKMGFSRRMFLSPRIMLTTGFRCSTTDIDAPATEKLPSSLYSLATNLSGEYLQSQALAFGMNISPVLSSDLKQIKSSEIRLPVILYTRYQPKPNLMVMGGVVYSGQEYSSLVLPAAGIMYSPSIRWTLALGMPKTGIIYRCSRLTEISLTGERTIEQYRLHDAVVGANILRYQDYRVVAGLDIKLWQFARLGLCSGYAFNREMDFHDGSRSSLDVNDAIYGQASIGVMW